MMATGAGGANSDVEAAPRVVRADTVHADARGPVINAHSAARIHLL